MAASSFAYAFSHTPWKIDRGGGTCLLLSWRWCFSFNYHFLWIFYAVSVISPIKLFIIVIYLLPGSMGDFLDEIDMLLSVRKFSVNSNFHLTSSTPLAFCLSWIPSPWHSTVLRPCTKEEMSWITCPSRAMNMTTIPLHTFDHHLVSLKLYLPILSKIQLPTPLLNLPKPPFCRVPL